MAKPLFSSLLVASVAFLAAPSSTTAQELVRLGCVYESETLCRAVSRTLAERHIDHAWMISHLPDLISGHVDVVLVHSSSLSRIESIIARDYLGADILASHDKVMQDFFPHLPSSAAVVPLLVQFDHDAYQEYSASVGDDPSPWEYPNFCRRCGCCQESEFEGWVLMVPQNSSNIEAAKELMDFMSETDSYKATLDTFLNR
jgi:hypothetical protein